MKSYGSVHDALLKMIEEGKYTRGTNCDFRKYYETRDISSIPMERRTPELCSCLMNYSACKLSDVPETSRTREFYINAFCDEDVKAYIKNNPNKFDRQFFKDLIESDQYSTHFDDNLFTIMPLEYIDEEMCVLAIVRSTDWTSEGWFRTVIERRPEVISKEVWLCAVQFYTEVFPEIVILAPEEYRDNEFYLKAFSCTFNCGMSLKQDKAKMRKLIPETAFTQEFLKELIYQNYENICRIPRKHLYTVLDRITLTDRWNRKFKIFRNEEIWKIAIKIDASLIKEFADDDEIVKYYIDYYGKHSFEFGLYISDNLRLYSSEIREIVKKAQGE